MALHFTPNDLRLGALYRIARDRRMDGETIRSLMVSRCGLSEKSAAQLTPHWLGSFKSHWKLAA